MAALNPRNRGENAKKEFKQQKPVSPVNSLRSRYSHVGPYILERLLSRKHEPTSDGATGVTNQVFISKWRAYPQARFAIVCVYYFSGLAFVLLCSCVRVIMS